MHHENLSSQYLNNKKNRWFIFIHDKYEGPYSEEEITQKITTGRLTEESLIWTKDFEDWIPINKIEFFSPFFMLPINNSHEEVIEQIKFSNFKSRFESSTEKFFIFKNKSLFKIKNRDFEIKNDKIDRQIKVLANETAQMSKYNSKLNFDDDEQHFTQIQLDNQKVNYQQTKLDFLTGKKAFTRYQWHNPFSFNSDYLVMMNLFIQKLLSSIFNNTFNYRKIILIFALFSTIIYFSMNLYIKYKLPSLEGVSHNESREMYSAISESFNDYGPTSVIVMAHHDLLHPIFYIATNLPENTELKLYIEGISETLLNAFNISIEATIKVHNGIAQSPLFVQDNGESYPIGEYKVAIKCFNCTNENDSKLNSKKNIIDTNLNEKIFFIGGTKDREYDQNLKVYHDKLRQQATSELIEIKQFADNFEQQLNETNKNFAEFSNSAISKEQWIASNRKWNKFQNQISKLSSKWNTDIIQFKYYYSNFYSLLKNIETIILQIHQTQTNLISKKINSEQLETEIFEKSSIIQTTLLTIRTKVALIEHLPISSNGMPPR